MWWLLALPAFALDLPGEVRSADFMHQGPVGQVQIVARYRCATPVDAVVILPLPAGLRLEASSVRADGATREPVNAGPAGEVALPLTGLRGEVEVALTLVMDAPAWPGPDPRLDALVAPRLVVGELDAARAAAPALVWPLLWEPSEGGRTLARDYLERVHTGAGPDAAVTVRLPVPQEP